MANLADIPNEFLDSIHRTAFITWVRTLPIDPTEKRDFLFLWATAVGTQLNNDDVATVMKRIDEVRSGS